MHVVCLCLLLTGTSLPAVGSSQTTTAQRTVFEDFSTNITLFHLVNNHHHPILDRVIWVIVYAGSGWAMLPILLLTFRFRRSYLAPLLIAVAIETVVVVLCKSLLMQPRPAALLGAADVHLLHTLYWGSFPSGDTAMACAVSVTLLKGERRRSLILLYYAYPLLVAYERLYIGVHFPLDIVAGAAVGIIPALLAHRLVQGRRVPTSS